MKFIFSRRFYILFAFGLIPLFLSWGFPVLRWIVAIYDFGLLIVAFIDYRRSKTIPKGLTFKREIEHRLPVGKAAKVSILVVNESKTIQILCIKDEFPPDVNLKETREAQMSIAPESEAQFDYEVVPPKRGEYHFGLISIRRLSNLKLVWCQDDVGSESIIRVYPNMHRAREMEFTALGANNFIAAQRRSIKRGEGREFESLRDYIRGDELRHISWTATARRARLTTRQYQIERDQTVMILIDSGRLMTGRVENETKFETSIHASLALMSAASRGGDFFGVGVFGRMMRTFLPPRKGIGQLENAVDTLYDIEPEMIEPSYSRAFQFAATNLKKRSFVVILTDLVDKESSSRLILALKLLRPRHLPLVVTIGDRDLNQAVSSHPAEIGDVFGQSASHEIIAQREAALRRVETMGGLALDVSTSNLAPKLLQTYLRVKERGML